MFTRIVISAITLILAAATIFYFQYFIVLISRSISSGISGVVFAVSIALLRYSLPIAAILEAVLLAGLTDRGLIEFPHYWPSFAMPNKLVQQTLLGCQC